MKRMMNFLTGVISGALVGATVALLLTPASGEELRSQIQDRAITLQEEVKEAAAARRAELEEQLETLRVP